MRTRGNAASASRDDSPRDTQHLMRCPFRGQTAPCMTERRAASHVTTIQRTSGSSRAVLHRLDELDGGHQLRPPVELLAGQPVAEETRHVLQRREEAGRARLQQHVDEDGQEVVGGRRAARAAARQAQHAHDAGAAAHDACQLVSRRLQQARPHRHTTDTPACLAAPTTGAATPSHHWHTSLSRGVYNRRGHTVTPLAPNWSQLVSRRLQQARSHRHTTDTQLEPACLAASTTGAVTPSHHWHPTGAILSRGVYNRRGHTVTPRAPNWSQLVSRRLQQARSHRHTTGTQLEPACLAASTTGTVTPSHHWHPTGASLSRGVYNRRGHTVTPLAPNWSHLVSRRLQQAWPHHHTTGTQLEPACLAASTTGAVTPSHHWHPTGASLSRGVYNRHGHTVTPLAPNWSQLVSRRLQQARSHRHTTGTQLEPSCLAASTTGVATPSHHWHPTGASLSRGVYNRRGHTVTPLARQLISRRLQQARSHRHTTGTQLEPACLAASTTARSHRHTTGTQLEPACLAASTTGAVTPSHHWHPTGVSFMERFIIIIII